METDTAPAPTAEQLLAERRTRLIVGLRRAADLIEETPGLDLSFSSPTVHHHVWRSCSTWREFIDQARLLAGELTMDDNGEVSVTRRLGDDAAFELDVSFRNHDHRELAPDQLPAVRYALDHGVCPVCGDLTLYTHIVKDSATNGVVVETVDPVRWHAENDPCMSCDGTGKVKAVSAHGLDLGEVTCPTCEGAPADREVGA